MTDRIMLCGIEAQVLSCGGCGVVHAIPAAKYDKCVEEGGFWTCPNGCSRGFREGKRAQQAIVRERDRLKQENARLAEEATAAQAGEEKTRRSLELMRRRAKAGTCPCCQRTVAQMARHMKTKHPDYNVVALRASK